MEHFPEVYVNEINLTFDQVVVAGDLDRFFYRLGGKSDVRDHAESKVTIFLLSVLRQHVVSDSPVNVVGGARDKGPFFTSISGQTKNSTVSQNSLNLARLTAVSQAMYLACMFGQQRCKLNMLYTLQWPKTTIITPQVNANFDFGKLKSEFDSRTALRLTGKAVEALLSGLFASTAPGLFDEDGKLQLTLRQEPVPFGVYMRNKKRTQEKIQDKPMDKLDDVKLDGKDLLFSNYFDASSKSIALTAHSKTNAFAR